MTWATISTRQMVLKNRINCLESQLIKISQDLQDAYDDSSYDQQISQLDYGEDLAEIQDEYKSSMDDIYSKYKDSEDSTDYTKDYNAATKKYLAAKKQLDDKLNATNTVNQGKTDARSRALEAQQEQVETQLEASRAEYDQLDKACSNDIQKGAIKLVSNG